MGREQTARVMRLAGMCGTSKGKTPITTRTGTQTDTRPDVVNRNLTASCPNRLWVADITYVLTTKGFVYTACITDVFSRTIIGWALSDSLRT